MDLTEIEHRLGKSLFDQQREAIDEMERQSEYQAQQPRMLIHFPTGKGKSVTALACLAFAGYSEAVVITPPATYAAWTAQGEALGISVQCMSHEKFRQKDTKLLRTKPVIADEFHKFGGHKGKGWMKLDRLARGLQAPLILMSATPNYNDAERVYCIHHVLDPVAVKGGFIEFIYKNCTTEPNYFAIEPKVTGFLNYQGENAAALYLADLPGVVYLEDDLIYSITDIPVAEKISQEIVDFGYDRRNHRMIASIMEGKHTTINQSLIDDDGLFDDDAMGELYQLVGDEPTLIFCNHKTVAKALGRSITKQKGWTHYVVHGETPLKMKEHAMREFIAGRYQVLVATASLATGPDGMDKVCDQLVIVDDTEDDALRRQLIGRIMPRGSDTDASNKRVHRLVLS